MNYLIAPTKTEENLSIVRVAFLKKNYIPCLNPSEWIDVSKSLDQKKEYDLIIWIVKNIEMYPDYNVIPNTIDFLLQSGKFKEIMDYFPEASPFRFVKKSKKKVSLPEESPRNTIPSRPVKILYYDVRGGIVTS